MTYEPLHHKYRPQTFAALVGQEAIATTLTNAIRTERIAPAYLFTGSRGTGKTSSARILAKSLNCLKSNKPTEHPCGVCDVCVNITKGYALDVIEIDAASNTGVDNIRELIEKAQFAPVQCRYKVYVIDECHQLSSAAFNALLKTLEEPPKQVVFVLATTDPQRVLPTIISRCQRFDFRRIPLDAMVKHLHKIADLEKINITGEAITLLAQVAQGGLRDAESLLDQLSLLAGVVTVEQVWDLVGAVPERDLMELLRAIASDNPEAVLEKARNLMDRGREPLIVLQNLAGFYRDLLIAKTAPNRNNLVAVTSPTWTAMCEFIHSWETATILKGQKHLKDSEVQIKNTTQPRLWLEVTLLGLLPSADVVRRQEDSSTATIDFKTSQKNHPQLSHNWTTYHQSTAHSAALEPKEVTNSVSPHQLTPQEQISKTTPTSVQREDSEPILPNSQLAASVHVSTNRLARTTATGFEGAVADKQRAHTVSVNEAAPEELEPYKRNVKPKGAQEIGASAVAAQQSELEQVWQQVLAHLQPHATLVLLRQQCRLLAFDKTVAVACIGISSQPLLKLATSKLPNIEAAFEQVFKQKVKVNFQVGGMAESRTAPTEERHTSSLRTDSACSQEVNKDSADNNYSAKPSLNQPSSKVQSLTEIDGCKASYAVQSPPSPARQSAPQKQLPATQAPERETDEVAIAEKGQGQEADELAIATQSFTKFFDAEIINLSDDLEKSVETLNLKSLPEPAVTHKSPTEEMSAPAPELELDDDDDVPF